MSIITRLPEANLWQQICKEFAARRAFAEGLSTTPPPPSTTEGQRYENVQPTASDIPRPATKASVTTGPLLSVHDAGHGHGQPGSAISSVPSTPKSDFDPSKHTPVFCTGRLSARVRNIDGLASEGVLDPAVSHPAAMGHVFLDKPTSPDTLANTPRPNPKQCSPRQYLELYVFPVLIPALEAMLHNAKRERCFERKRTVFNAMDFLTNYLYNNNSKFPERQQSPVALGEIPFVAECWADHPRPPLPLSLIWTEEEAATKLVAAWRGYLARRDPEIAELRQWQREWREANQDARARVKEFWADRLPDNGVNDSNQSLDEN